jgi:hypothetical protein
MSEDNKFPLGKSAFLILKPNAKSLVLLDSKEQVLDARFLLLNETVCTGHTIDTQVFSVLVGKRISSDSIDHGIRLLNSDKGVVSSLGKSHSSSKEVDVSTLHRSFAQVVSFTTPLPDVSASALPVAFDFAKGVAFSKEVHSKFGHQVNFLPNKSKKEFFLVISFGRASFRLDMHTVGIVLQAHFGGIGNLFKVKFLRDRTFKFSVASTLVGFHIYNIGAFSDSNCKFFIKLWGNGGANWQAEERVFYKEETNSWKVVQRKSSVFHRLSFQNNNYVVTPSVFDRLSYPTANFLARPTNSRWQFQSEKENSNWHNGEFNRVSEFLADSMPIISPPFSNILPFLPQIIPPGPTTPSVFGLRPMGQPH